MTEPIWPEKSDQNNDLARGYNMGLDACKKAWGQSMDDNTINEIDWKYCEECLGTGYKGNISVAIKCLKCNGHGKLGFKPKPRPVVTVESVHEVIKKWLLEYNITLKIGRLETAGAGKILSEAIVKHLGQGE